MPRIPKKFRGIRKKAVTPQEREAEIRACLTELEGMGQITVSSIAQLKTASGIKPAEFPSELKQRIFDMFIHSKETEPGGLPGGQLP